ncbi:MAG: inositol monophosphatase family protein, partial [Pseudomonadota bacterium]
RADLLAAKPAFDPKHWPGGLEGAKRSHRPSLAYRLCLVAEGRFDAMITLRRAWEWDIAAGTLVVREAGGVVTDSGGIEAPFNAPEAAHAGCLAAPPPIHAALLKARGL